MIHMMIVEDDYIVRLYLTRAIQWENHQIQIVAQATNGKEALDKLKKYDIDIVLTDIGMPQMNGIELIKIIQEQYPKIQSIVLSCHEEFELVKNAMKYGAKDYILKHTMEEEKLVSVIKQFVKETEEKKERKLPKADQTFLTEMLIGSNMAIEKEKIEQKLADSGIYIGQKRLGICLLQVENRGLFDTMHSVNDPELFKFALSNILEELVVEKAGYWMQISPTEFVVLLTFEKVISEKSINDELNALAIFMRQGLKKTLKIDGFCYIGPIIQHIGELNICYKKTLHLKNYKIYKKNLGIIQYDTIPLHHHTEEAIKELIKKLKDDIAHQSLEEMDITMLQIIRLIKETLLHKDSLRPILIELAITLQKSIVEAQQFIEKTEDIHLIINQYHRWYEIFTQTMPNQKVKSYRREVQEVILYMKQHIASEISLNEMAHYVGMSSVYFSQLFKKETGGNFVEYLINLRIEAAKRQLCTTQKKVYEIGEDVGFKQSQYFIRTFKASVGMTPKEYREEHKK